ncbi:hypothetical protein [Pseudomonas eucalypticola]|uniref:Uncharacterized protein n=1 Tax=Pseudomonas eucalypticola TaxID=2599595 RepID=A0A7D5HB56_9PSED|nr:hypothetical protein [Pseudomonas eucalypticola]QKZ07824.1 hypothetical protein HWQ56_28770 [Pseudomonas eucalypticola]
MSCSRKDRDTEIIIRALGGKYYPIQSGVRTNWNPFKLDLHNPITGPFLKRLTLYLAAAQGDVTKLEVGEVEQIEAAVNSVLRLDLEHRRLAASWIIWNRTH